LTIPSWPVFGLYLFSFICVRIAVEACDSRAAHLASVSKLFFLVFALLR
jgi:hypothetical protein